jgi:hypothetical protein
VKRKRERCGAWDVSSGLTTRTTGPRTAGANPAGRYQVRNWKEYDKALQQRGEITLWVDEASLAAWKNQEKTGRRGASRTYSDTAILVLASLRQLFHLPGRACEGFLRSIFTLMGVDLPVPDHSTLSRRLRHLEVELGARVTGEPVHIVIDSSGMKVYGEGEWKVRMHGYSYRRTWRKLHIGVNQATHEIVAAMATVASCDDAGEVSELLDQVEDEIRQVSADGAYDSHEVYDAVVARHAIPTIRPRDGAVLWKSETTPDGHGPPRPGNEARNQNVRAIQESGREEWKRKSGYTRRSLSETGFFRLKTIFGDKLHTRELQNQFVEMFLNIRLLNTMTHLGMPDTVFGPA